MVVSKHIGHSAFTKLCDHNWIVTKSHQPSVRMVHENIQCEKCQMKAWRERSINTESQS